MEKVLDTVKTLETKESCEESLTDDMIVDLTLLGFDILRLDVVNGIYTCIITKSANHAELWNRFKTLKG